MTKFPDQVLNSRLIVKPMPKAEEIIGSVVIPGSANAELEQGIVIKISDELIGVIEAGDSVIYPAASGVGQLINGTPHLWLRIEDIWGNFKPSE